MANNTLLASDSFTSGSLAAGWAAWPGLSVGQVIVGSPNVVEANAILSGFPGIFMNASPVTNSQISSWNGGNAGVLPPFSSGTSAFDILFEGRLYISRVVSGL
jgi:hypothetical protein